MKNKVKLLIKKVAGIFLAILTTFSAMPLAFASEILNETATQLAETPILYAENIISQIDLEESIKSTDFPILLNIFNENISSIKNNLQITQSGSKIELFEPYYLDDNATFTSSLLRLNTFVAASGHLNFETSNIISQDNDFAVLYSKNSDIIISSSDVNLAGIIYAPNGTVTISASNMNFSGAIIAKQIVLNGNNFNLSNDNRATAIISAIEKDFVLDYTIENDIINLSWNLIGNMNAVLQSIDYSEFMTIDTTDLSECVVANLFDNSVYQFQIDSLIANGIHIKTNILSFEKTEGTIKLVEHQDIVNEPLPDGIEIYEQPLKPENIMVDPITKEKYVKNQILLTAKKGVTKEKVQEFVGYYQGKVVGYISSTNDYQIEFTRNYSAAELKNIALMLEYNPDVECTLEHKVFDTEPQEVSTTEMVSDDPHWGFDTIDAQYLWDNKAKLKPVKVGIIDTGFITHKDVKYEALFNNETWKAPKNSVFDSTEDKLKKAGERNHSLHVAGTIAANNNDSCANSTDVKGVSPNANLYCSRIDSKMQSFTLKRNLADLIVRNVKVINFSIGSTNHPENYLTEQDLEKAITYEDKLLSKFLHDFIEAGYEFIIVQAAGNNSNQIDIKDPSNTLGWLDSRYTMCFANLDKGNVYSSVDYQKLNDHIIVVGSMKKDNGGEYSVSEFSRIGERVDIMAPGSNITSLGEKGAMKMNGTSMAAPHVTGVIAAVWGANPTLTSDEVKSLIITSNNTEKVRVDINDTNGTNYLLNNSNTDMSYSILNAEKALKSAGVGGDVDVPLNGSIIGKINFGVFTQEIELGKYPIVDFAVQKNDSLGDQIVKRVTSDVNGEFTSVLPQGKYVLNLVSKTFVDVSGKIEELQPFSLEFEIKNNEVNYLAEIDLMRYYNYDSIDKANVSGLITNALTGNPEASVKVTLYKNWILGSDNTNIAHVDSVFTDNNGRYIFDEKDYGYYTAVITKDGYVQSYFYISIYDNTSVSYNGTICPALNPGEMRIILTWGSSPSDLDSHLTAVRSNNSKFAHVYYSSKTYNNGSERVVLDVDDVNAYGPETTTIYKPIDGKFRFSVYNYSRNSSKGLSNSSAKVTVVTDKGVVKVLNVPLDKNGYTWNVFDYDGKILTPLNTFSNDISYPSYNQVTVTRSASINTINPLSLPSKK